MIDVLRGLSILAVVLLHIDIRIPFAKSRLAGVVPREVSRVVFRSGFFGVRVFFVVSGFLITMTMLRRWRTLNNVDVSRFYELRVARIAPCLLGLLSIVSLLHFAGAPGFVIKRASFGAALFAALTFHINMLEIAVGYLPATWDVLWSLSIEEVFYALYPLLLRFVRPLLLWCIAISLIVAGPLARTSWASNDLASDYSYLAGFDCIAFGCIAAIATSRWTSTGRASIVGQALGAAMILLVVAFRGTAQWLRLGPLGLDITVLSAGTAILLWGSAATSQSIWSSVLLAPVRSVGRYSYEIYLTHSFLTVWGLSLFQLAGSPYRWGLAWDGGILSASVAVGRLVSTSFSEPVNRNLRRWLAARRLPKSLPALVGS